MDLLTIVRLALTCLILKLVQPKYVFNFQLKILLQSNKELCHQDVKCPDYMILLGHLKDVASSRSKSDHSCVLAKTYRRRL